MSFRTKAEAHQYLRDLPTTTKIKLRVNLLDCNGYEFEYPYGDEVMEDRTVEEMFELYQHYELALPPLEDIISFITEEMDREDWSDEDMVDKFADDIEEAIPRHYGDYDADEIVEVLFNLLRDMYNYIMYSLVESKLLSDHLYWEFLEILEVHYEAGKLYIDANIYVEALRDLDFMDERRDIEFLEVVNELKELHDRSINRQRSLRISDRNGQRGLLDDLVA